MSKLTWSITLLNDNHERQAFDCGEIELNEYLQKFSGQHARTNISRTFIVTKSSDLTKVLGFYTLSTGSIGFANVPVLFKNKLPRYPIPVVRIGRLAVDCSTQGQGLGEYLLMDALHRCVVHATELGIFGVVVDAKHEKAKNFYFKYGFHPLTDYPLTLILPIQEIKMLVHI